MKTNEIVDVFAAAVELSRTVPEELREAAFHHAVELLSREGRPGPARQSGRLIGRAERRNQPDAPAGALFNDVDSSAFAEVQSTTQILDRSLWILRIGREHLGLDAGMTADDVSQVLTDKFRIKTAKDAVRKAFDRAPALVDRVRVNGSAARYRIMAAGDRYLAEPAPSVRKSVSVRPRPRSGAARGE